MRIWTRLAVTQRMQHAIYWLCLFCRPSKEQLVVSTTTYIRPDQLLCPGLFVCLPRESCIGVCSLEQLSGNSMNDDVEEEGFAHKAYHCSEDQLMGANRKDSQQLKLCTGLEQVLPNLSSYKTRNGKFCNDSGFSEIICTGLLNTITPGSTALQTQNPLRDPKESDKKESSTIQRDSQLTNDSGILLHGHQYSQQERSKLHRPPTTSRSHITLPHNLPHNLHQETDTITHEDRDELVMAGGDHRLQDAAPTEKLVVSKQRPLDVVGFCPEDKIVMSTMSLHSPLASHKADRLTIDRRHCDVRIFSCNMPCD